MQKKLPADPFLKKALRISLILHGSLVVVVLLQSAVSTLFNSSSKEEAAALKKSQMAKQAIRVDMVDLPRYKLEDLKNIDLTEEVGEEEIKTSESEKESGPSENAMKFKNEEAAREAKAREELQKKS